MITVGDHSVLGLLSMRASPQKPSAQLQLLRPAEAWVFKLAALNLGYKHAYSKYTHVSLRMDVL